MHQRTRLLLTAAACVALLPAVPALSASDPATTGHPGSQDRTLGPLVSGTSSYVGGTFVWTDYVYDDRGPTTDPVPGGDTAYPAGTEPGNAADLVQLQLGLADDGRLHIGAVLETLVHPQLPLVGVGFDTDRNAATGAASVPGGSWANSEPLGLEQFVTLSAAGAQLLSHGASGWVPRGSAASTVDQVGNRLQATVGLTPGRATWRAVGVVGLAAAGQSWRDGSGAVYDLAFVRAEDPNTNVAYKVVDSGNQVKGQLTAGEGTSTEWQDKWQSAILAGRREASAAAGAVDFGAVADGRTSLATAARSGWETFLYYSPLNYGQGYQSTPSGKRFAGPYQPYGVLLPARAATPTPLVVFLHGANENHLQNRVAFAPTPAGRVIQPGYFSVPAIVVFALGRDPHWGTGAAEQDVLDIMSDIRDRYVIDDDRVVVTGISAGGFGTFRMTELHPDKFAGGFSLVGGDGTGLLGNLVNTPIRMQNGLGDPLVGVRSWKPTVDALSSARSVDFRAYINANRSHTHVPALGNCVLLDLIQRGRVVDPARVTYGIDPSNEVTDEKSGLVIRHTGAYWVSGLALRTPEGEGLGGRIDAVTSGRAVREFTSALSTHAHNNAALPRDYCGRNPNVRTGDTWVERSNVMTPGPAKPVANAAHLRLRNIAAVTLDLSRMALSTAQPLTVTIDGDGPTTVRLSGPWSGPVQVRQDGALVATVQPAGGALAFDATGGGMHRYLLTPE